MRILKVAGGILVAALVVWGFFELYGWNVREARATALEMVGSSPEGEEYTLPETQLRDGVLRVLFVRARDRKEYRRSFMPGDAFYEWAIRQPDKGKNWRVKVRWNPQRSGMAAQVESYIIVEPIAPVADAPSEVQSREAFLF